jgi:hypothetical protein
MHAAYQLFEKACMMIQLWNVHGRLIMAALSTCKGGYHHMRQCCGVWLWEEHLSQHETALIALHYNGGCPSVTDQRRMPSIYTEHCRTCD